MMHRLFKIFLSYFYTEYYHLAYNPGQIQVADEWEKKVIFLIPVGRVRFCFL